MTPLIEISDEVFRRLQELSEPLVDTPNSVIGRLIAQATSFATPTKDDGEQESQATAEQASWLPGLFLAPSTADNLSATVLRPVLLRDLEARLDRSSLSQLHRELHGVSSFHCWAMTVSSRGTFAKMRVGDLVLFTPKGTGRFQYRARVAGKLESQRLGDALWRFTPGKHWSLIYLLEDVQSIDLIKHRLLAHLGYDSSFAVYGITRVRPDRLKTAIERFGSLEGLLASASAQRG
jgi:hypothetical protein